jgi:3-phosphoglycerate kinase
VAGLLVEREVEVMGNALRAPDRPLAALLGGAKVGDKILVLKRLLELVDQLYIGGGMAVTFLRALGYSVGASSVEENRLAFAAQLLDEARSRGISIQLPADLVIAARFEADCDQTNTVSVDRVTPGWYVMDIGRKTVESFVNGLRGCQTIIWNGPMGVFEFPRFARGTRGIAEALPSLRATTVVGGGSTAEAVEELGLMQQITHVSTGGGASLEFLEGKELPGIAALPDA